MSDPGVADGEVVEEPNVHDHVPASVGGMGGHLLRRTVHLAIVLVPVLYYWWGDSIAATIDIPVRMIASIIGFTVLVMEGVRLRTGLVVYGQREYEARQPSALFWGVFSISLTVLIAPEAGVAGAAYGAPVIWSLAIVDPALGEARRYGVGERQTVVLGFVLTTAIWLFAAFALGTPAFLAPLIAAITVAAERPRLTWLDDNGAMVLAPLAFIVLVSPFL